MAKQNLVLIKLGGSIITDKSKPFTAREEVILRLGNEIKSALKRLKNTDLILAHGSGSFGHTVAMQYQTAQGLSPAGPGIARLNMFKIKGFPLVADSAVQINRIVIKNLLKAGLLAISFAPLSFTYSNGVDSDLFLKPVTKALGIGLVPVIYGDVVMDEKQGFRIHSGETTLNLLAVRLKSNYRSIRVIEAGNTDGVYDKFGRTIPVITPKTYAKMIKLIGKSSATDVTGGMLHKVKEAVDLAEKCGIEIKIVNGNRKENLKKTIKGRKVRSTIVQGD